MSNSYINGYDGVIKIRSQDLQHLLVVDIFKTINIIVNKYILIEQLSISDLSTSTILPKILDDKLFSKKRFAYRYSIKNNIKDEQDIFVDVKYKTDCVISLGYDEVKIFIKSYLDLLRHYVKFGYSELKITDPITINSFVLEELLNSLEYTIITQDVDANE